MKTVLCQECAGEIKAREDLVVALIFFKPVAYHSECYVRALKGCQSFFVDNIPLNGLSSTIAAWISAIAWVFILLIPVDAKVLVLIALSIMPIYRTLSWLMYERHLEY